MKKVCIMALAALLALPLGARKRKMLDAAETFDALELQLKRLSEQVESACAVEENVRRGHLFPCSLRADWTLLMGGARDWRSGFYAGMLWMMYERTRDSLWLRKAEAATWPIESVKTYGGTHDLGFMVYCSFGNGARATGEARYDSVVVQAARTLLTRYNPTVRCIRSWDFNREKWQYPVIIDNMMNLELLFRATQLTGDSTFWHVAVAHADRTMQEHFRPDASSYHVIDYDPTTGQVRQRNTAQGFADESFWARGQAWGLYGYTMCYRFTCEERYLRHAQRIARFWLSLSAMPADGIPYWDMKLPAVDASTPRDASAAAIAASAFLELANYVSHGESKRYRRTAINMLKNLSSPTYRAPQGTHAGFLLMHSTGHKPNGNEIDVPLIYADYYYMEALMRMQNPKVRHRTSF